MSNFNIYGQDSRIVSDFYLELFNLEKKDTRYNKIKDIELFDFVGFILNNDKMLSIFPKNYFTDERLEEINEKEEDLVEDIEILFNVIYQYIINEKSAATASKYIGNDPEFDSDYPFAAFFSIYNYYQRFGIYKESIERRKKGYNGKISWKDTIQKSPKIISKGNLIYAPFYISKKTKEQVFITDCMAYVIDYTLQQFPYFINLRKTQHKISNINYFENRDFIITKLRKYKNEAFKDLNKNLIQNLINFFESFDGHRKGGDIHIKINYFDKVWEKMVKKYLNDYFESFCLEDSKLIFDKSKVNTKLNFRVKSFNIDESENQFTISPDHYTIIGDEQYIFDSKYYDEIKELNYKQVVYYELLKRNSDFIDKTYCALILPGNKNSKIHYKLAKPYKVIGSESVIIECYLNVKEVMKNYIGNDY